MLYDVELDLNESSKGREQIFKQILLQLSIIEGYKGDLCALFRVSIFCPVVLKVFFSTKCASLKFIPNSYAALIMFLSNNR